MGAPDPGMQAAEQPTAETLLTAFRTIKDAERQRHVSVLDYWLSIRGDKEFPPLHDLDALEISDAGPNSILLELISGGQDAEIRYLGDDLRADVTVERIIDAPNPSILSCIAKKLPIVAISRDFLAFEDSFDTGGGWTRCWVTLLPLSSCGSWVDYVYAFVSVEAGGGKAAKPVAVVDAPAEDPPAEEVVVEEAEVAEEAASDACEPAEEVVPVAAEEPVAAPDEEVEPTEALVPVEEPDQIEAPAPVEEPEQIDAVEDILELVPETEPAAEPVETVEAAELEEPEPQPETEAQVPAEGAAGGPGFSKLLEGIANLAGFYGQGVKVDPVVDVELPGSGPEEPAATEPPPVPPEAIEPEAIKPPLEVEGADLEPIEQPVDEMPAEVEPEEVAPEPAPAMEGSLQSKLTEVRAKADEAQQAQLRAVAALHEGLSAAYDFALDAETSPEEYLRLVEAQGLKIQLRAPMAPVAKLAFGDSCDGATIKQLEAVLAWALKEELPRGSLLGRIEDAGGIAELLKAA